MFSKSCKYGIRAVLYLAVNTKNGEKIGVKEIAENLNVPKPFLAKILQELSRHNLISSAKGPTGGFFLNKENLEQPLLKIIESIDGQQIFSACILGLRTCSAENPCPLHFQTRAYYEELLKLVSGQSIEAFSGSVEIEKLAL